MKNASSKLPVRPAVFMQELISHPARSIEGTSCKVNSLTWLLSSDFQLSELRAEMRTGWSFAILKAEKPWPLLAHLFSTLLASASKVSHNSARQASEHSTSKALSTDSYSPSMISSPQWSYHLASSKSNSTITLSRLGKSRSRPLRLDKIARTERGRMGFLLKPRICSSLTSERESEDSSLVDQVKCECDSFTTSQCFSFRDRRD
jgi:hypothetical protein